MCIYTQTHTLSGILAMGMGANEITPLTTRTDLEVIILRKVNKRKTNTICYFLQIESKYTNLHSYETEANSQTEQTCSCHKGTEAGEGRTGCLGLAGANYYTENRIKQGLLIHHRILIIVPCVIVPFTV